MTSLSIQGISKKFGATPVLRDISLSIDSGDLFFILGASGCGKSTLLRIIAGLETADSGALRADGVDLLMIPAHLRGIGMVFQQYALWPHMTVEQNVSFGLEVQRVASNERKARVREALDLVRMGDFGARYPHEISGGQQQRVALARALAVRPKIILLDEPLSNLDARLREEIRYELQELHRSLQLTMIYVTHDQEDALALATKVALLRSGSVEQVGTPRELYDVPRTPYAAEFLGRANIIECSVSTPSDSAELAVALPCAGGATFSVRRGSFSGAKAPSLCIRPEHLSVRRGDIPIGVSGIPATVTHVSYKGPHLDVECEAATGERIMSRSAADDSSIGLRAGEFVTLTWAPKAAVLVDTTP